MHRVPDTLLQQLLAHFATTEQFAFFDTSRPAADNSASLLFENPAQRLTCRMADDADQFLDALQRWLDKGYYLAGWFGYEFGGLLLGRSSSLTCKPEETMRVVADIGVFRQPRRFDHLSRECDYILPAEQLPEISYTIHDLHPNIDKQTYLAALQRVLAYIRAGDTYQVNFTLKLLFDLGGSPEALYRDLRRSQSVSYGAYIRWGDERVMSFSPELFFRKDDAELVAKPMKGTLARGRNAFEDAAASHFLQHDVKNCSENVMIVDLLRNDLGRVLHEVGGGVVEVKSLFDVEPYESLLQMTSTVVGRDGVGKLPKLSLATLFKALYPCGSITGAPKIRTMEIIAELEEQNRGVYTGAIGFLGPDGHGVFNVPIRTLHLEGTAGEMGIGAGITHDSDPEDEWQESLLKGRFLTNPMPDFQLFETMLWQPDNGYWLLSEHLERLISSAGYLYFSCDQDQVRHQLHSLAKDWQRPKRVKLMLAKDGCFTIDAVDCSLPVCRKLPQKPEPNSDELPQITLSGSVLETTSPWCMHKTTNRELYDREHMQYAKKGYADVLFANERAEICEGAITNIFVYRNGRYYTPPVTCGLLAGVMRRRLLAEDSRVEEKVLKEEDVASAEAIFISNSVRGVMQVRFVADGTD